MRLLVFLVASVFMFFAGYAASDPTALGSPPPRRDAPDVRDVVLRTLAGHAAAKSRVEAPVERAPARATSIDPQEAERRLADLHEGRCSSLGADPRAPALSTLVSAAAR